MTRSREEQALHERFEAGYAMSRASVMLAIERCVRGCDYGGNSWINRSEADRIVKQLGLRAGLRHLDLGAGSGWPGLYMAKVNGCDIVLVDLPLVGLRLAAERAATDGMGDRVRVAVADAARLPFPDGSFDTIGHSDLLCCLRRKRSVLAACRRAVRNQGRMVFTVISIAPGLTASKHRRAVENGPDFIETDTDYASLLTQSGWLIEKGEDVTSGFGDMCRRQIEADRNHEGELTALIGDDAYRQRLAIVASRVAAIHDGLLRRELFVAVPDGS